MHAALFGKTDCVEAIIRHHADRRAEMASLMIEHTLKEAAEEGLKELVLTSYDPQIKAGDVIVLAPDTKNEEKATIANNYKEPPIKLKYKLNHTQYALAC